MGIPQVLTQQIDSTTWQALGLVLTLVGLMVSFFVWRRSGAGRGLHAVAWSLLPLAAGLTGLLRLAWEILDAVLQWAGRLVFSPVVWVGLVVAGVAVLLYVTGSVVQRRSAGSSERTGQRAVASRNDRRQEQHALQPADQPTERQAEKSGKARGKRSKDDALLEDQDDIEAILRKHGIS